MTTKTEWLSWLEARAGRLQRRYRQARACLPRHSDRNATPPAPVQHTSKTWGAIVAHVEREPQEVVVHLELPKPHTVEADVRVIDSTLAISVLRRGSGIERARLEDCYRRAIPLPPQVDPGSTVHKIHGDELVIRMQPTGIKRRSSKTGAKRRTRSADEGVDAPAESSTSVTQAKRSAPKTSGRRSGATAQVSELPVGAARRESRGEK